MFSQLSQGFTKVLQELSGDEPPDGDPQDMLAPQLPPGETPGAPEEHGPALEEDVLDRLAHLEQLTVQLKEVVREKDSHLASLEMQLKSEKETSEARFTKLKLQAKAKMASLTKQMAELKGQEVAVNSPDSSFTSSASTMEVEVQELRQKLSEVESSARILEERLHMSEKTLREKELAHTEQLQVLQSVICEKDVRFQDQIQKHEEELLRVTAQSQNDSELQQALRAVQRRCEEQEEAMRSRSQVLEMLQEELNNADQQKQILTAQFRQMEQEVADTRRQWEEEREQWADRSRQAEAELVALRADLESSEQDRVAQIATLEALQRDKDARIASLEASELEKAGHIAHLEASELEIAAKIASLEASELDKAAQIASLEASELDKAAQIASLEASELDKAAQIASLEASELDKAAQIASLEASELDKSAQIASLEASKLDKAAQIVELNSKLEWATKEREEVSNCDVEVARLEKELAVLREEHAESQRAGEALSELLTGLHSLLGDGAGEENPVPTDPARCLDTLHTQLERLKLEQRDSEERFAQVTQTMGILQEQLDRSSAEGEKAVARIQQLEQQIEMAASESQIQHVTSPLVEEVTIAEKDQILTLEQLVQEKDYELAFLRERLALADKQSFSYSSNLGAVQNLDQGEETPLTTCDSPSALPDLLEDSQEGETTLVAEDSLILSVSVDNESSPELIRPQSDSPGESKGASSDEMVTSSDSEVAHSSWTLLEALNQDEGQQWPSVLQDIGQIHMQSWEENSSEKVTSTVQMESSSVVIHETVQVQLSQHGATLIDTYSNSGQVFAQALADELQTRYSELQSELLRLREAASESQDRTQGLEEEIRFLTAAKAEAESRAQRYEEELQSARSEMHTAAQHSESEVERQSGEMHLLEERLANLQTEISTKEQKSQALLADLDESKCTLSEKEDQVRMLSAQLANREFNFSELEQKLQGMEANLLEFSQTRDLAKASLSERDNEITELQLRITQKEQEIMELDEGISAKLLQAGEEKFLMSTEVKKLKEQITELEKTGEKKNGTGQCNAEEADELASLRKEKEDLSSQLSTVKKKLQAALLQRKELMKKVAEFEKGADQTEEEGNATEESPAGVPPLEKERKEEVLRLETALEEFRQILRSKEEAIEVLEQKISQQDQLLAETLAMNRRLSEVAEQPVEADNSNEFNRLQSQVTSLESDCETLQKKLQEAQDSRKDTIRKAKEKDRHHREQLKQQKDEYNELLERLEEQVGERDGLVNRLRELEQQQAQKQESSDETKSEKLEKPAAGDWVQEDWVDFAATDNEAKLQERSDKPIPSAVESSRMLSAEMEGLLQALREEVQTEKASCTELRRQLQESQDTLSFRESELLEMSKEVQALREKESQIDHVYEELEALKDKCVQAQTYAETLKAEMEANAKGTVSDPESSITVLQAEVEEFKQFLSKKNNDIMELGQQLCEQSSVLQEMQETVSEKDRLINSLQDVVRAEQEKSQRMEAEVPQRQEEEKDTEAKILQLQQKLKAALISRKEALKESKSKKEELASTEKVINELQQKMESKVVEMEKLRAERERLIEEVDRTLVENQSLGASCESLKLAMEGMQTEKEFYKREAEVAKEDSARSCKELEDKMQGMKDEYEILLKSYENVSDEAERVRRVLEAARQERKELAAKVRTHEAAREEAERQKEEAQKEVDTVKDKMRKFAKTKQQKIMDLEEENERLREMEEKKGITRDDKALRIEVDRLKEELETLKVDLGATSAQRDSFQLQVVELKEQLAQELEKREWLAPGKISRPDAVVEETVVAQHSGVDITKPTQEPVESPSSKIEPYTPSMESEVAPPEMSLIKETVDSEMTECLQEKLREMEAALQSEKELRQEREAEFTTKIASLEQQLQGSKDKEQYKREEPLKIEMSGFEQANILEKLREMEATLKSERERCQEHEAELNAEIASLKQCLQESKQNKQSLVVESSEKEAKFKELLCRLEAEKDDLEERLMNQLAQLNGSIAGYQQDASDSRERLTELQREVERLLRERAELEALVESEKERATRLEEDKRQAQRERAEAEAESGKQRELEQQLKSAQRVREGSQSRAKQLEELLREKQLEVRQMQKNCIQYQERISEMAKECKALQLGSNELHKELGQTNLEKARVTDALTKAEAELSSCKAQLVEARREASQTQAEKSTCEQKAIQRVAELKLEAEQTLDAVRFRLGAELKQIELRLEESYREREREEGATREARELADNAERQTQKLQGRLDESLARLAAFSRCMSSLQDDRDRVLDETRQWESRFNSTLQGKEAEVREAETRARDLAEQLQTETAQREELQLTVDRLQKADEQWQLKWEQAEKSLREKQVAVEQERGELQKSLAQAESSLAEARAQLASLETEAEGLRHRAQALEEAVGKLQGEANDARSELREMEAKERRLGLSVDQLETDLRSSKTLTETLQAELSDKEQREVELLGEKEQAVTQAAEEARREADARAQEAEKELEERREEVRGLEDRLRKAEQESSHSKARLDAFTKAMGSLQDDRDHILSMYKQLEERHLQVMMDKDSLIQEAAGENNSLKEELRSLLVQRDDLHAEKAKLSALLHGYRDDLTQVLTMKESQYKQLLAGQLEHIAALEKERGTLLAKIRECTEASGPAVEKETLSQAGDAGKGQVKDAPGAEVEKLREQLQAARAQVESLEDSLAQERTEHKALEEELKGLRWEGGVTRTESETAAERVAELARDLLEMEQRLLEEREVAGQLRAQNQAFGQAMASLQDSRDRAIKQAQDLSLKLEETSKVDGQTPTTGPGGSTAEVWALKNALSALQNDRERLLEELQRQQAELARLGGGELSRLGQELDEERRRAEEMRHRVAELDDLRQRENQELEMLRQTQAELLKQKMLAPLSDHDQGVRRLGAMLEEAHTTTPKLLEEQYQREAPLGTDLSPEVQALHPKSESGTLNELQLRQQEIAELRNQLSQVCEENQHLSSEVRGRCQRLDEAESRCAALQRQLRELHKDKCKGTGELDSAPGAPQQYNGLIDSEGLMADFKDLQHRLDEEQQCRMVVEEQLIAAQDRLKRINQGDWQSASKGHFSASETSVLIEPPGGSVTRTRSSSGPGLSRMLRVAFCSRQRTPLLVSLYFLTVHVLLLLCMGGYL